MNAQAIPYFPPLPLTSCSLETQVLAEEVSSLVPLTYKIVERALEDFQAVQETQKKINEDLKEILRSIPENRFNGQEQAFVYIKYTPFCSDKRDTNECYHELLEKMQAVGCDIYRALFKQQTIILLADWHSLLAMRQIQEITHCGKVPVYGVK